MPDCNETLRELQTYLDGELGDDAKKLVDSHLFECNDCMQAFDFHAELKMVIAAKFKPGEMPKALLDKIQACFGPDSLSESDETADGGFGQQRADSSPT